jgi:hypothetical protein
MLHLLQLEWLKQKHNRTFLVLIGMYALLLPTLILSTKTMPDFPPPINSSDTFFNSRMSLFTWGTAATGWSFFSWDSFRSYSSPQSLDTEPSGKTLSMA